MTYNDLRCSIYESYQSGEISGPQATQMLEKVMDIEGDHIVAEYEALESTFMGVAMEAANGCMDFTDFQEQAQVYTEGVKEIWNKFLDWVKGIISAIFGIEFKGNPTIEVSNDKVSLYKKFTEFCKKITNGKADEGVIGGIVGLAAAAGASIFGTHRVKMKLNNFKKIQDDALDAGKDVVTYMADHADDETVKKIGARGQRALEKIFNAVKDDKKGVIGRIRKFVGSKVDITKENIDKVTVNAPELTEEQKKKIEELYKSFSPDPAAHPAADQLAAGLHAPGTGTPKDGKQADDGSKEESSWSDFTSGDILSESSSWDDIFAYMDI